jgi:hypothetical protein
MREFASKRCSAAGKDSDQQPRVPDMVFDVYFNTSHPIKAIGMPIFIKRSDRVVRKATANAAFIDYKCVYLSVSHVFFDDISAQSDGSVTYDSEYDLGSGTEYEDEDEFLNATSLGSVSSTKSKSTFSTPSPKTDSIVSSPTGDHGFPNMTAVLAASPIARPINISVDDQSLPPPESLNYLGSMKQHSVELNWAVIDIGQSEVASTVYDLKTMVQDKDNYPYMTSVMKDVDVIAHTSRGPINGQLSRETVSMRLPNSTSFEEVHQVVLDSALAWGDCGVGISDAVTEEPYGHVVATSATKEIAYIVPAQKVFEKSGTQWKLDTRNSATSPGTINSQGLDPL